MNHLLSERSIESLDSSRPGGSIPHSWWRAWVGLFVVMVEEVEILRGVGEGRGQDRMANPRGAAEHGRAWTPVFPFKGDVRMGGGQCCEGQRLWAVWGSWVGVQGSSECAFVGSSVGQREE